MGGLFQLFGGRGRDFQELGHCPLFGLLWLASKLSWCLWVCCLANVLQQAYNEEIKSSAFLGLIGSNQFMSYPHQLCHTFKGSVLCPFLLSQYYLVSLLRNSASSALKTYPEFHHFSPPLSRAPPLLKILQHCTGSYLRKTFPTSLYMNYRPFTILSPLCL